MKNQLTEYFRDSSGISDEHILARFTNIPMFLSDTLLIFKPPTPWPLKNPRAHYLGSQDNYRCQHDQACGCGGTVWPPDALSKKFRMDTPSL